MVVKDRCKDLFTSSESEKVKEQAKRIQDSHKHQRKNFAFVRCEWALKFEPLQCSANR